MADQVVEVDGVLEAAGDQDGVVVVVMEDPTTNRLPTRNEASTPALLLHNQQLQEAIGGLDSGQVWQQVPELYSWPIAIKETGRETTDMHTIRTSSPVALVEDWEQDGLEVEAA